MNKSQTDRAHSFVTWMKSKGLATLSSFLRPLNDPAGYVKRFGDKLRIPKSKRVPVELLPKSSMCPSCPSASRVPSKPCREAVVSSAPSTST